MSYNSFQREVAAHEAHHRRAARQASQILTTHCCFCAMGCAMNVEVDLDTGQPLSFKPHPGHPVNQGRLCMLGHAAGGQIGHADRLTQPLVRRAGRLEEAGWDEALALVAERFLAIQAAHGRSAVGVYGGGSLTTETCYLMGKLARVALGTSHVDYNGRFCMSAAATASNKAFGIDRGLGFPLSDIPLAECIILAGSNAAETLPTIMQYFQKARGWGTRFIVVDPRRTWTAGLAHLHLQVRPGTDLALANALLHVLINEGLVDEAFIADRTRGWEAVREVVAGYTPAVAARITGVPAGRIIQAARLFGRARTGMILTARGVDQHAKGVDAVLSYINLALAAGKVGRRGCGVGILTGQANGQGGREHGMKADQLPGYRSIENPEHRRHIASVWGVAEASLPGKGKSAYEMLDAIGTGEVRGLFVLGSNPVVSNPNAGHIRTRLSQLEFLVVTDIFLSETARLADVVLPGSLWAEEEGTVTNLEGRVLLRRKVADPPGAARADWRILCDLARLLGAGRHFPYRSPRDVFEELRVASRGGAADYAGITPEKIVRQNGVFWPCPSEEHPGTPRMFQERFAHPDGRALFHPVEHRGPAEATTPAYPLRLTTGRVIFHYLSGNQTRRLPKLNNKCPEPFVQAHPLTAARLGLVAGERVWLRTRRGRAVFRLKTDPGMRRDTVFIPFHWGDEGSANLLTNPALDPVCRMPEFKVCAAALEPLVAVPSRGAGRRTRAGEGRRCLVRV